MDVHKVLPYLVSVGVISPEENATIQSVPSESEQAKRLASDLQRKGSGPVGFGQPQ